MKHEGVAKSDVLAKMAQSIACLKESVRCIRLGTVTPSFVDTFKVPYCGQQVPIGHLAQTSRERGLVTVKPHDPAILGTVAKILSDAGLNAYVFSKHAVAVSVPPISGEERERVKARVKSLGDDAKVAIRNIRKASRNAEKSLPKDEARAFEKWIQQATDEHVALVDEIVGGKLDELSK